MRGIHAAVVALAGSALFAACDGSPAPREAPAPEAATGPLAPATAALALPAPRLVPDPRTPPAADPRLEGFEGWPLAFVASGHVGPGRTVEVEVRRGDAVLARPAASVTDAAVVARWDGRDEGGAFVAPGPVEVVARVRRTTRADAALAEARQALDVLRIGIDRVQLAALEGGRRVPLLYRKTDGVVGGFHEVGAELAPWRLGPDGAEPATAGPLDDADGAPRPAPAPWDDLLSPPLDARATDGVEGDTYNLPTAWTAGSRLRVTARFVAPWAGDPAGGLPADLAVRLVPPKGTALAGPDAVSAGAEVVVETLESPVPAVMRAELALGWALEGRRGDGPWRRLPGRIVTRHRLYGLVAEPTFAREEVPHRAWVDVVDQVASWVDGATADPTAVAGEIVRGVYSRLGLAYDRARGADAYIRFPGTWNGAAVDLSGFQDRAFGSTVNCSDNAGIVSAYANMVGIDLRYQIVRRQFVFGFDLHPTQPIGSTQFLPSPFLSGRAAFSFHAITEAPLADPDASPLERLVFDSTLAVDGDEAPSLAPHLFTFVDGLARADYLSALSPQWEELTVFVDEKMRVE